MSFPSSESFNHLHQIQTQPSEKFSEQQRYLVNERRSFLQNLDEEAKALSLLSAYCNNRGDAVTAIRLEKAAKRIHQVRH